MPSWTPALLTAAIAASASAEVVHIGFSQKTWRPDCAAATICSAWYCCGVQRMTASILASASASSNCGAVSMPSADATSRACCLGSMPSTGATTALFVRVLRMVCPHHPRPMIAALIMRGFRSGSRFRHFRPVPVADLTCGHQRDAIVADDVVEQGFQIFDAVRDAGDVRMNGDRHDPGIGCALEVQPVEL